jgi:hypothetical protein
MNTYEIVKKYLLDSGFDGLVNDECGCSLSDFAPCGDGPYNDCCAAIRLIKPEDGDPIHPRTGKPVFCPDAGPGDEIFVEP